MEGDRLVRGFIESAFPISESQRQIDRDYHLEVLARNSNDIREYELASLKLQSKSAALALQATGELASRQYETNANLERIEAGLGAMTGALDNIAESLEGIEGGIELLSEELAELNATTHESLRTLKYISATLGQGLDTISKALFQQQQTLRDIETIIRRPYDTKARELRDEADKWLLSGMSKPEGRDRAEDWTDATRLFRAVVANPIGMQDYVAWFQIGWLLWRHEAKLVEAENAFYRAQRLSASTANLYHVKSIRHHAHMLYLQAKYEEAFQSSQRAMEVASDDPDALFDIARYAARTHRRELALRLLDKCIELRPATMVAMFAEVDFQ